MNFRLPAASHPLGWAITLAAFGIGAAIPGQPAELINPTCPFCAAQVSDPEQHAKHVKECEKKARKGQGSLFGQQQMFPNPRLKAPEGVLDRYQEDGVSCALKGFDRDGDPRYGWPHTPEAFITSEATHRPIRFHVEDKQGLVVHPNTVGMRAPRPACNDHTNPDPRQVLQTINGDDGMAVVITHGETGWHATLRDLDAGESVATYIYPTRERALESANNLLGIRNPAFFTDDEGEVHPISGTPGYERLATYSGQRHLQAVRPDLYRQLTRVGAIHTPQQVERHLSGEQRKVDREYESDLRIEKPKWAYGWSKKDLLGLGEYAGLRPSALSESNWWDALKPEVVSEYRDKTLTHKRGYGLMPSRREREHRRERQSLERQTRRKAA